MSEEKTISLPRNLNPASHHFQGSSQHDKAFSGKGPVSGSESERDTLYIHLSGHHGFLKKAVREGGATDNNWPKV